MSLGLKLCIERKTGTEKKEHATNYDLAKGKANTKYHKYLYL